MKQIEIDANYVLLNLNTGCTAIHIDFIDYEHVGVYSEGGIPEGSITYFRNKSMLYNYSLVLKPLSMIVIQ